jgi:hypothetical protein
VPELVADFEHQTKYEVPGAVAHPLLCWGDDCVWDGEPVRRPTLRAPKLELQVGDKLFGTTPVAIVQDGQVCTDGRCDAIGPKLRAAIDALEGETVRATADREAVVIRSEVWSRSKDAKLALPAARRDEGEIETIHVIGNRLAIGRGCNEYCPEIGRVVDSRGRAVSSDTFVFGNPIGTSSIPDPIDLAGDRFLLFSGFGDVALISKGKSVANTHVGVEGGIRGPVPARVLALPLNAERVALEVCTPVGCQLALLSVSEWSEGRGRSSTHLEYYVVRQLPRCTLDPPSY